MIKPVGALYHCKRSHAWLKIKPFIEVTLTVVAVEEGTGKNEGLLRCACCGRCRRRQVLSSQRRFSGFTDENREQIWANKQAVIGQLVEVRADAVTISQDHHAYSLRFPRFKTFRGFEIGEKL